jgi:hypothetical protein
MLHQTEFTKAEKPKGFTAYHYAVTLCLMQETPPITLSQATIGERTGMSRDKVIDVLKDLRAWKWIHAYSGKRQYNTNSVEVIYANLPRPEPTIPLVISDKAVKLAAGFKMIWLGKCGKYKNKRGWNCTRPLRKDWKKRWEPAFQRLFDEGYSYNELVGIINNANAKILVAGPQNKKLFPSKEEGNEQD